MTAADFSTTVDSFDWDDLQDYVRALTRDIHRRLPTHVDYEELVSSGMLGLIEARERWRPDGGASFRTFAYYRVRGAVRDAVRKMSGFSPGERRRTDALASTAEAADLRTEATHTTGGAGALAGELRRLAAGHTLSQMLVEASELPDQTSASPGVAAVANESIQRVRRALSELPEQDATLLRAVHFEGQTMTALAAQRDQNKSTVSRAHAKALDRLTALLIRPASQPSTRRSPR